jgi:hypothetical protein
VPRRHSYLSDLYTRDPEMLRDELRVALWKSMGNTKVAAKRLSVSYICLWEWLTRMGMNKEPAAIRLELAGRFRLTG